MRISAAVVFVLTMAGCIPGSEVNVVDEKEALLGTDREFAALSIEKGAAEAFNEYLLEEAIMLPAGQLPVEGRSAIYEDKKTAPEGYVLAWRPVDGEVARSGDFGYTWGEYTASITDSAGVEKKSYGKYLNVWKKDPAGKWKVLVDTGNQSPPPRD